MTHPAYAAVLDSVKKPLDHFITTGLYEPYRPVPGAGLNDLTLSESIVRSSIRGMAAKMRRPFIQAYVVRHHGSWKNNKWSPLEAPIFSHGYFYAPKQKKLQVMLTPLQLGKDSPLIKDTSMATVWEFGVHDETLWNDFYQLILNDPDCRKARGLT